MLIAAYVVVALGLGLLSSEPPHVTPLWSMLALTLCGVAVLGLLRSRFTLAFIVALLLTLLSLAYGTGAEFFIVLVLLYRAGVVHSARAAWIAFASTTGAAAVGAIILAYRFRVGPSLWGVTIPGLPRDPVLDWANFFVVLSVFALIATLLGVSVGHRRRYVGSLVQRAEQMERERDQQAEISSARERERIAREMHDVIAHSLSVMIAMADGAHALAETRPDETKQAIARVADTGRRTLGEVRRLLGSVRGDEDATFIDHLPQPGASQIPVLVSEFRVAGLPVRLDVHGVPADDNVLGLTVYRIVQESLTNVLRHGRSTRDVVVQTEWLDDEVTILIEDSSLEASVSDDPGRGIFGIRERAALYDGTVEAAPREGGGWRVFVRLQMGSNNDD